MKVNHSLQVTILSGAALSDPIDVRGMSRMIIHMPAAWTAASIALTVAQRVDGTYLPLNDTADALIEIDTPVADTGYQSAQLDGVHFLRLWSETAGVDVNQAADRTLLIDLFE